jgi:hypothetical protein
MQERKDPEIDEQAVGRQERRLPVGFPDDHIVEGHADVREQLDVGVPDLDLAPQERFRLLDQQGLIIGVVQIDQDGDDGDDGDTEESKPHPKK